MNFQSFSPAHEYPSHLATDQPKGFVDGTHRSTSPAETLSRMAPLFPAMGITRVVNVTGLDRIGVPVVCAIRPNSRSLSVSQGKGLTLDAAKASAVMETIESYHAERLRMRMLYGSYEDLCRTAKIVDTTDLPRTSTMPYHESQPMVWVEGYDLISEDVYWLPYELSHTRFTIPRMVGSGCFPASSNGLASGNHHQEATSHGICEVIERDSTTLWYMLSQEQKDQTRVDPATVTDRGCCEVLDLLEQAKIDVAFWETTTDIGVPSFLCQINERNRHEELFPSAGMGCHPDRGIALLRAVTEAVQSRVTYIAGSRDDMHRKEYRAMMNPMIQEQQRFMNQSGAATRAFTDVPTFWGETFNDDLRWIRERLMAVGIQHILVVDLTLSELAIPVVKVTIPGLEGLAGGDFSYSEGKRARARRSG
jgi:ribosomal protein S12 methylthiotransferase accessory factor